MSKRTRLTREDWLTKALDVLVRKGSAELNVNRLANSLGVTKGSFYWHFKDRNDFVRSLLDYWMQGFTMNVVEKINATSGNAQERLLALMQFLNTSRSARFDVAIRAWAARDTELAALVKKADEQRQSYVGALFHEMGFRDAELQMRIETFVVFHSFKETFFSFPDQSEEEHVELLKLRHAFFIRPQGRHFTDM